MNYINTLQAEFEEAFQDQKMLILEQINVNGEVRIKFIGTTLNGRQVIGAYTSAEGVVRPFMSYFLNIVYKDPDSFTKLISSSIFKRTEAYVFTILEQSIEVTICNIPTYAQEDASELTDYWVKRSESVSQAVGPFANSVSDGLQAHPNFWKGKDKIRICYLTRSIIKTDSSTSSSSVGFDAPKL